LLFFAVLFVLAVAVLVLVLTLEQRGDPRLLERKYAEKRRPPGAKD
jgi:hypothetical protein